MFEVEKGFIYRTVSLVQNGVKVELESFKDNDHAKQANFVFDIIEELTTQMTSVDADDILVKKLCEKFGLIKKERE